MLTFDLLFKMILKEFQQKQKYCILQKPTLQNIIIIVYQTMLIGTIFYIHIRQKFWRKQVIE